MMDLFDRKIIGWSLANNMTTEDTIMATWKMAIKNRATGVNMIFHSDWGVQYASDKFRAELKRCNVIQSMSRKGNCWDNSVAESFFKILKSELIYHNDYLSYFHARLEVFEFIEVWYNRKRRHEYLGYKTPEEFGITTNRNIA